MRKLIIIALVFLAVIAIVAAGAILARKPIAERVALSFLADKGLESASLEVATLNLERVEVRNIRLGPDPSVAIEAVDISYEAWALATGRPAEFTVDIRRPVVRLEKNDGGGFLEPFGDVSSKDGRAEVDSGTTAARAPAVLPTRVSVTQGSITLAAGGREATATIDGEITPRARGLPGFDLSGTLSSPSLPLTGSFRATHRDQVLNVDGKAQSENGFSLSIAARTEGDIGRAAINADLTAVLPAEADFIWSLLPGPQPTAGSITLAANLHGKPPAMDRPLPATSALLLASDALVGTTGEITARLDGLAIPQAGEDIDGKMSASLEVDTNGIAVTLQEPAQATIGKVARELVDAMGAPPFVMPVLRGPVTLRLQGRDGGQFRLASTADDAARLSASLPLIANIEFAATSTRIDIIADVETILEANGGITTLESEGLDATVTRLPLPADDAYLETLGFKGNLAWAPDGFDVSGTLEAAASEVAAEGVLLRDFSATIPFTASAAAERVDAALAGPAAISFQGGRIPAPVELRSPVRLTVDQASLSGRDWQSAKAKVEAILQPLDLTFIRENDRPLDAKLAPGPLRIEADLAGDFPLTRVATGPGVLNLPDLRTALSDIFVTVTPSSETLAEFRVEQVVHSDEPPAFTPARVEGNVRQAGDAEIKASATATLADGAARVNIVATSGRDGSTGTFSIESSDIVFAPGDLQPADLSPRAAFLSEVDGKVVFSAKGGWQPAGLDSSGEVKIEDLSFETRGINVTGLHGRVELERLLPPQARPEQSLEADQIVAGIPINDATVRFGITSKGSGLPHLVVKHAEGKLLAGLVSIDDWTFDPAAPRHRVDIKVTDLSLASLAETLSVKGLQAKGKISGTIPVELIGGEVVIDQGKLSTSADGELSYASEAAEQVLSQGGEQVDLMMQALRDFRYENFSLEIVKPESGEAMLKLSMLGRNPAVLDGYPFQFNITLSGDLEPLLEALAKGRKLSSDLLQRSLKLR